VSLKEIEKVFCIFLIYFLLAFCEFVVEHNMLNGFGTHLFACAFIFTAWILMQLLAKDSVLKPFKSYKKSVKQLKRIGDVLTVVVVAGMLAFNSDFN